MTTLPKNVRRLALILGSVLVAGPLVTVLTSAAQAPAQPVAAAPSFVLKGSAVGGVQLIQPGQVLTFDFTETNKGSKVNGEDLVLEKLTNVTGTGVPLCVDADGSGINPDGSRCEPGTIGARAIRLVRDHHQGDREVAPRRHGPVVPAERGHRGPRAMPGDPRRNRLTPGLPDPVPRSRG